MLRKLLACILLLASVPAFAAGPTITNIAVSAVTSSGATIIWTTSSAADSQVFYGIGNTNSSTAYDPSLITSHTATLSNLVQGNVYSYNIVSANSGGSTTSVTNTFALCNPGQTGSGFTRVSAQENASFVTGTTTATWVNNSGSAASPKICGVSLTTPTTATVVLPGSVTFSLPDNNYIVPSPGSWTFTQSNAAGLNSNNVITGQSVDLTATFALQASTGGGGLPGSGTNPFNATSTLALPDGTQGSPALGWVNVAGLGWARLGAPTGGAIYGTGAADFFAISSGASRIALSTTGVLCFASGNSLAGAGFNCDSGISRSAGGGELSVNDGSADENGYWRSANICRVTADITLSTSPTNICTFASLPASAKPRYWHCDVLWSVTAGTTPTLTIGVNPSQTPTGTTNAWAELKTTNANVATENAVPLSASGNTNILTTPTLTTAATIFSGSSFGTLLASGTTGSFAITMTGTGAGFAGVARAGTGCYLF